MDVCIKGDIDSLLNLAYSLCRLHIRDSHTHNFTTCPFQCLYLIHRCLYISSISICHGLDRDRGIASNLYATNGNLSCFSAGHTFGKCNLRSEEHTSELQSQSNLVCRLLLEKNIHPHPASLKILITFTSHTNTQHIAVS